MHARSRAAAAADKIVVLAEGKVAEQGSPDELLARDSMFKRMAGLQAASSQWSIKD